MFEGLRIDVHNIWKPDPVRYNCSGRSVDEWYARGIAKPLEGSITLEVGCVVFAAYMFIIYAMSTREFLKNSCNQLLFFSAICDSGNAFVGFIISGYYMMIGSTFCVSPRLNYAIGAVGTAFWCGSCISVISLAYSRLAEFSGRGRWIFQGKMVFVWVFLAITDFLFFTFLTTPGLYSSFAGTWLVIPFISDNYAEELYQFRNDFIPLSNMITANSICLAYLLIFLSIRKTEAHIGSKKFTTVQKKLLIQCSIICITLCISCYMFSYAYFFGAPWIAPYCQLAYELNEVAPIISYLGFNSYVRQRVFSLLRLRKIATTIRITSIHSNTVHSLATTHH